MQKRPSMLKITALSTGVGFLIGSASLAHAEIKLSSDSAFNSETWTSELVAGAKHQFSDFDLEYALSGESSVSQSTSKSFTSSLETEATTSVRLKTFGSPLVSALYNNSFEDKTTRAAGTLGGTFFLGSGDLFSLSPTVGYGRYTVEVTSGPSGGGRMGQGRSGPSTTTTSATKSTSSLYQSSQGLTVGLFPAEHSSIQAFATIYQYNTNPQSILTSVGSTGQRAKRSTESLLTWLSLFAKHSYGTSANVRFFSSMPLDLSFDLFRVVSAINQQSSDYFRPSASWEFISSHAIEVQHERSINVAGVDNWAAILASTWNSSFSTEIGATYDLAPETPLWGGLFSVSYSF